MCNYRAASSADRDVGHQVFESHPDAPLGFEVHFMVPGAEISDIKCAHMVTRTCCKALPVHLPLCPVLLSATYTAMSGRVRE